MNELADHHTAAYVRDKFARGLCSDDILRKHQNMVRVSVMGTVRSRVGPLAAPSEDRQSLGCTHRRRSGEGFCSIDIVLQIDVEQPSVRDDSDGLAPHDEKLASLCARRRMRAEKTSILQYDAPLSAATVVHI